MAYLLISGFYPEPNPDDSLQFKKAITKELEAEVLAAMGWASQKNVPPGEIDLTLSQTKAVMELLGHPIDDDLVYSVGLYR